MLHHSCSSQVMKGCAAADRPADVAAVLPVDSIFSFARTCSWFFSFFCLSSAAARSLVCSSCLIAARCFWLHSFSQASSSAVAPPPHLLFSAGRLAARMWSPRMSCGARAGTRLGAGAGAVP